MEGASGCLKPEKSKTVSLLCVCMRHSECHFVAYVFLMCVQASRDNSIGTEYFGCDLSLSSSSVFCHLKTSSFTSCARSRERKKELDWSCLIFKVSKNYMAMCPSCMPLSQAAYCSHTACGSVWLLCQCTIIANHKHFYFSNTCSS